MGLQWRQQVDEIPPGWVTLDERFVLFILADETKDDRTAWGHEIAHLCDRLGGVSETWLRARLSSLESAGYITRPRQRRNSKGQWNRRQVSLAALKYGPRHDERGSGVYRPTAQAERKAAADAKRSQNLTQGPPEPLQQEPRTEHRRPDRHRTSEDGTHRTSEDGPSPNIGGLPGPENPDIPGPENPDNRSASAAAPSRTEVLILDHAKHMDLDKAIEEAS